MSETAWTPGPWRRFTGGTTNPKAYGVDGNNGRAVVRWQGLAKPESDESQANAHLIAAAPELYEALRLVSAIMACDTDEESKETARQLQIEDPAHFIEVMRNMNAILAKARGER